MDFSAVYQKPRTHSFINKSIIVIAEIMNLLSQWDKFIKCNTISIRFCRPTWQTVHMETHIFWKPLPHVRHKLISFMSQKESPNFKCIINQSNSIWNSLSLCGPLRWCLSTGVHDLQLEISSMLSSEDSKVGSPYTPLPTHME